MYHSLYLQKVGEPTVRINTYSEWKIVPSSRPLFNPPPVKEEYVDIPGRQDGPLDLTGTLTGLRYGKRTGSWEFYVLNRNQPNDWDWYDKFSDIQNRLNGYFYNVWLEDDPLHYYVCKLTVNSWQSPKDYSRVTINYEADPIAKDSPGGYYHA